MSADLTAQERASLVMARCDVLGAISEEPDRLTRRYATDAMRRANDLVAGWMTNSGMRVTHDPVGNLLGHYAASEPDAKTLLLGSHLDTVRDAGKYDGPLGVMVALAAVERLHALGRRLPFNIEVIAFADEEGLRYRTSYLGSRSYLGALDPAYLSRADEDGIILADAIRAFGGDPDGATPGGRSRDDLLGYVEVHIEQGPVLEARNLPVGVVSSIQGQSGVGLAFTGEAGHAGTVPMPMRRDALTAAAEFALAVEAFAQQTPGLVSTVGRFEIAPGASNVIPGQAMLSLDVRHPDDATRLHAVASLRERAEGIAERRGLQLDWREGVGQDAVKCSPRLIALLTRAVEAAGHHALALPSGAGHDAAILSQIADVAMLFVRCAGGVSHSPKESVAVEDVAVALDVLDRFLSRLAHEQEDA
jgi:allantoate deiminase